MGANIYVYGPSGVQELACHDLGEGLETFFDGAAENLGASSDISAFNLDYERTGGEDPDVGADRLEAFLQGGGSRSVGQTNALPGENAGPDDAS